MTTHVIFYSLSGNTAQLCKAVAEELGAELHRIEAKGIGRGFWSMVKWGFAALRGRRVAVETGEIELAPGDLVILGAQVWAGRVSVPMASWLDDHKSLPPRIALVLTSGDARYPSRTFDQFAQMAGHEPLAHLHVSEKDVKEGNYADRVAAFCQALGA